MLNFDPPAPSTWIIRGMARPSVRIPDLGLTLLYGQEVRILEEQARRSRDLSLAFTAKTVVRVERTLAENLQTQAAARPAPLPPTPAPEHPRPAPLPAQPAAPQPLGAAPTPQPPQPMPADPSPSAAPPEWAADLMRQNAVLTTALTQLLAERPSAPAGPPRAALASRADDEDEAPEAPVIFVPEFDLKPIQGDVTQAVKSDLSSGDSLSDAAALLSQLRGPGGRKRRRGSSDDQG